jgi:multiple antibiotic resistance protein
MGAYEFAILSLVSLLIMVNPISIMPVYASMTSSYSSAESRRFALRGILTALIVMLIFAGIGKFIFDFFSISIESLRIVGGILFFLVGYEMLSGKEKQEPDPNESGQATLDQSITPFGVPLICGPGAISTVMLLMNQCNDLRLRLTLVASILMVTVITFIALISARPVTRLIGRTGINVIMRITGLIVMAIAVELLVGGLTAIVPRILGQ